MRCRKPCLRRKLEKTRVESKIQFSCRTPKMLQNMINIQNDGVLFKIVIYLFVSIEGVLGWMVHFGTVEKKASFHSQGRQRKTVVDRTLVVGVHTMSGRNSKNNGDQ